MSTALYAAFMRAAEKHPEATAIVSGDTRYTYRQALERVTFLSQYLPGIHPDAAVIVGPKSADTVLWQLACNNNRKVFIPCDEATPDARLAALIEMVEPRHIIASDGRDYSEFGFSRGHVVGSFQMWETDCYVHYPWPLSHIILSSGSTGLPKAILLPDVAAVSVVTHQAQSLGVGPGARFAWMLSPSFDASLSDIYMTLLSGGELHVCNFSMRSVKTLQAFFRQHQITHSDLSPSLLPLLSPSALPDLKALIFGGELAKEAVVFDWVAQGKRLFNAYGPTETTICSSLREVAPGWTATNIGKPMPGVSYQLMDGEVLREGRPGDTGELYIGGEHLALGYQNREMTDLRFVTYSGERFFRSGDVVEVDMEGDYHFKGRADRQMKHHGVLICPEEVEAQALRGGATEALLKPDDGRLVLHYAGDVDEAELKRRLSLHLPHQVVPHRYVRYDALPKSIAGKIQL